MAPEIATLANKDVVDESKTDVEPLLYNDSYSSRFLI
jgi:hypothetical protein